MQISIRMFVAVVYVVLALVYATIYVTLF